MKNTETVTDVKGCPRCGLNHAQLRFTRLTNPVDDWKWWALCPVNGQPILMTCHSVIKEERK